MRVLRLLITGSKQTSTQDTFRRLVNEAIFRGVEYKRWRRKLFLVFFFFLRPSRGGCTQCSLICIGIFSLFSRNQQRQREETNRDAVRWACSPERGEERNIVFLSTSSSSVVVRSAVGHQFFCDSTEENGPLLISNWNSLFSFFLSFFSVSSSRHCRLIPLVRTAALTFRQSLQKLEKETFFFILCFVCVCVWRYYVTSCVQDPPKRPVLHPLVQTDCLIQSNFLSFSIIIKYEFLKRSAFERMKETKKSCPLLEQVTIIDSHSSTGVFLSYLGVCVCSVVYLFELKMVLSTCRALSLFSISIGVEICFLLPPEKRLGNALLCSSYRSGIYRDRYIYIYTAIINCKCVCVSFDFSLFLFLHPPLSLLPLERWIFTGNPAMPSNERKR